MINPISSAQTNQAHEASQPAARQPQPQPQTPADSAIPQDKVTLQSTGDKNIGDPDQDGK